MPTKITHTRTPPQWRYIVQRARTGQILTREADITPDDESYGLSSPGSSTFVTSPVIADFVASDGERMYGKYRTLIAAEADGQIRWRGIVTDVDRDGPKRTITVDSMSSYPTGIAYLGERYEGAEVDPADIVRRLWAHVQSYDSPHSDLGVKVVGSTGLKVGSFSTQDKTDTAKAYDAAVKAYDAALADRRAAADVVTAARKVLSDRIAAVTAASKAETAARAKRPKDPAAVKAAEDLHEQRIAAREAQERVVEQKADLKDDAAAVVKVRLAAKSAAYAKKVEASKKAKADGGAYTLFWWEAPDCGQAIDTLASDNGFEWFERHSWNADRSGIDTEIVIAYPRAGRRRRDLRFEVGENVTVTPSVGDSGDDFANAHVLIGAGEGAGSIRRETAVDDGSLRRVDVVSAKDVKSNDAADKRLAAIAPTTLVTDEISSIEVEDHDMAPIGSWAVGDDIRIDFWSPTEQVDRKLWHRITEWTRTSDRTATLTLKRANSFTYGG